ncbi:MAG: signal peptidase I [Patescibacteria group bacterium]
MDELENKNVVEISKSKKSFFVEIFKFALIAILIVVPFRLYVAQPFIVSGASMDPTFHDGDYLVIDQLSHNFKDPHRGEVVIFRYPKDETKFFIKRIIGLPNETVEIHSGVVVIKNKDYPDGFALTEAYITLENKKVTDFSSFKLGDEEFFVLGDNRLASLDSRVWGAVPEKLIVGRPLVRVLPIDQIGTLPGTMQFAQ